jgi:hypothetical protein
LASLLGLLNLFVNLIFEQAGSAMALPVYQHIVVTIYQSKLMLSAIYCLLNVSSLHSLSNVLCSFAAL